MDLRWQPRIATARGRDAVEDEEGQLTTMEAPGGAISAVIQPRQPRQADGYLLCCIGSVWGDFHLKSFAH